MRKYWLLLILPVALLVWWGLGRGGSAPTIHFTSARERTIESTVPTNGKVEPAEWAAARAEAAGVVQRIGVQRGQTVQAGQTLVWLDTLAAQSELAGALAQQQQAQAEDQDLAHGGKAAALASVENSIRSAQTALQVAERNYASMQRLAAQQAATKLQVQDARDAVDRARLQLAAFEDQRRTLVTASDRAVAEARLHNAQSSVSLAEHRLALDEVKAPLTGTVYQFDLKVGAYLQTGDLVALIGKLDQVKVVVYVDEPDLGRVGLGMPVSITWDARPGQVWWGHVDKLPTQVIALGSRTVGEVSTIVNNSGEGLLPGVTVNATIVSKVVRDTLSIPKAALRSMGGSAGVYKLDGHDLRWTAVKTGVSDINDVQILSGLTNGDKVADRVIQPSDAELHNGMRVRPAVDQ